MRTIVAALVGGLLTACAGPQYQTRLVAATDVAAMPADQVADICGSRATSMGAQVFAAAQSDARNKVPSTTGCNTIGVAATYVVNSNCTPTSYNPSATVVANTLNADSRSRYAAHQTFAVCVAQHGYRIDRQCVANCDGTPST